MQDAGFERWPNQVRAIEGLKASFRKGKKFPVIVSPTGTGKSVIMRDIIRLSQANDKTVTLVVHRRLLRDQLIRQFKEQGMEYGVQASGFKPNPDAPLQVAMYQTLSLRNIKVTTDVVIWDEAHLQKNDQCIKIQRQVREGGGYNIGVTATPLDLTEPDDLIIAGTYSEALECGAHLPLELYGPDEPAVDLIKPMAGGEYSEEQSDKVFKVPTVFGSVLKHWKEYNPGQYPTVLFASSAGAARWWVEEFAKEGIPWGSIDAERITMAEMVNGKWEVKEYVNSDSASGLAVKKELFERYTNGTIKGIANRFILREAWDAPETYCAIIATLMGTVTTYLQSVGRVMRAHDHFDHKLVIDHGGVISRLGVPNMDRDWQLGMSEKDLNKQFKEKMEASKETHEDEPICCPKCKAYRTGGAECPKCGYAHKRNVKMVRQLDGTLKKVTGRHFKYKKPKDFASCFSDGMWAAAARNQSLKHAMVVACGIARKKGITPDRREIKVKLPPEEKWDQPISRLFPWLQRRKKS